MTFFKSLMRNLAVCAAFAILAIGVGTQTTQATEQYAYKYVDGSGLVSADTHYGDFAAIAEFGATAYTNSHETGVSGIVETYGGKDGNAGAYGDGYIHAWGDGHSYDIGGSTTTQGYAGPNSGSYGAYSGFHVEEYSGDRYSQAGGNTFVGGATHGNGYSSGNATANAGRGK